MTDKIFTGTRVLRVRLGQGETEVWILEEELEKNALFHRFLYSEYRTNEAIEGYGTWKYDT
jgi:hypothetical protein